LNYLLPIFLHMSHPSFHDGVAEGFGYASLYIGAPGVGVRGFEPAVDSGVRI
jgi:hypothetical protein